MINIMKIKSFIDSIYRWVIPVSSLVLFLASVFMSYDFTPLITKYPNWKGIFEFIQSNILSTLLIVAFINLFFTLFHLLYIKPSIKILIADLEKSISKNELIAENVKNVFDGYLYQISTKLKFGSKESNCERVTVYIHDSSNHFIPFGRFSANPKLRAPGRLQYPDDQGCISHGWRNGWHFENDMGESVDAYVKNSKTKYAIHKKTLDVMKMKSKLYAVKRIDGDNGKQLAVLVVESLTQNRFEEKELEITLKQEEYNLSELIVKLKAHIPSLENAKLRGF